MGTPTYSWSVRAQVTSWTCGWHHLWGLLSPPGRHGSTELACRTPSGGRGDAQCGENPDPRGQKCCVCQGATHRTVPDTLGSPLKVSTSLCPRWPAGPALVPLITTPMCVGDRHLSSEEVHENVPIPSMGV